MSNIFEAEATLKVLNWLEGVSVGEEFNYLDIASDTDYSTSWVSKVLGEMGQNPYRYGIVRVKGTIWKKIGEYNPEGGKSIGNSFPVEVIKRIKHNKVIVSFDSELYVMTKLEI